ncbi:MAG TPA: cupin domain-containing protein [Micromonosporaceae bacterium]|nr:cupin domain-containing protein [Micromonosporaceae bacterium]
MAKASSATAGRTADYGVAIDRSSQLDGYTVSFVTITKSHDLGPMLASLPSGNCSCPHWGYVLSGRVVVRYADHQETFEAGDAFYMPPGHAPEAEQGTELIQFSPTEQLAEVEAAIAAAAGRS